jgi:hypothetical protein
MLSRLLCGLALVCVVVMGSGCGTTSGGGGGGGGNTGPSLTEYQLDGSNPELEADITALTTAYNAALQCIGEDDTFFTDQQNLDALKTSYTGAAADFPAYVDESRQLVENGSDEICNYALGQDAVLDGFVADITEARNRGRACRGDDPNLTDENSLEFLKQRYLTQVLSFDNLTDAAEALANDAAVIADEECGEE